MRPDDLNLNAIDPRTVSRAADYINSTTGQAATPADSLRQAAATISTAVPAITSGGLFRPMPQMMPMAAPGPGGGYNRYREMTLEELLLENRVVFLVGEIHHASATRVIMQMLYLQSIKREADINFYINSPGGVVDDTLAMYDIMKFLSCDIATYCIGRAESGGAVVFMAGKKGKRYILPNAQVMIHQPLGGITGQAADIEIQAEEILKRKDSLVNIMAKCTGQTPEKVREDSERDRFFSAKEAVAYGICDEVLGEDSPAAATAADGNKPK